MATWKWKRSDRKKQSERMKWIWAKKHSLGLKHLSDKPKRKQTKKRKILDAVTPSVAEKQPVKRTPILTLGGSVVNDYIGFSLFYCRHYADEPVLVERTEYIEAVSRERVFVELLKLIVSPVARIEVYSCEFDRLIKPIQLGWWDSLWHKQRDLYSYKVEYALVINK